MPSVNVIKGCCPIVLVTYVINVKVFYNLNWNCVTKSSFNNLPTKYSKSVTGVPKIQGVLSFKEHRNLYTCSSFNITVVAKSATKDNRANVI